jgi:hypothetical protein
MVGQAVEVLLGLVDMVEFPLDVDEAVTVALALLVFVPNPLADIVGVAVFVLEDIAVLDMEGDPVEVLELVMVLVSVFVIGDVRVPLGDREPEAEPVDVLEARIEPVCELEPVCVLDWSADLVYEGVAEFVLDIGADPVVVFEIVVVLLDVDELVSVLVIAEEADESGLEDDDSEPMDEYVDVIVVVIVLVEVGEGVTKDVGRADCVRPDVLVDVLEDVGDNVGTTKSILSRRSTEQFTKWS